jgi:hypothetical protein
MSTQNPNHPLTGIRAIEVGIYMSEVLRALGRTDAEISELKEKGVLGGV